MSDEKRRNEAAATQLMVDLMNIRTAPTSKDTIDELRKRWVELRVAGAVDGPMPIELSPRPHNARGREFAMAFVSSSRDGITGGSKEVRKDLGA